MKAPRIIGTNVTVTVKDMDRAVNFYKSIGFRLKQRWEDHYAMLSTKGLTVGLHPGAGRKNGTGSAAIGLMVEKIGPVRKHLDTLGIPYEAADGKSGRFVNLKDPDGNSIYFMEARYR